MNGAAHPLSTMFKLNVALSLRDIAASSLVL